MNVILDNIKKPNIDTKNKPLYSKIEKIGSTVMGPPRPIKKTNQPISTPSTSTTRLDHGSSSAQGRSSNTKSSNTKSSSSHRDGSSNNTHVIVSVCEGSGQARGVVGIAAIDINHPLLILSQITDTQTYKSTLTKVNVLQPSEILIPSTFCDGATLNRLCNILMENFPAASVTSVPRVEFNRNKGMHYINTVCADGCKSVCLIVRHKFYALAATSALLRYVENIRHVPYFSRTIKVEYQEAEQTVLIDIDTADRLELISCANPSAAAGRRNTSILSLIDHCVTNVGRRLLRATILQPSCRRDVIESRLDCVEELVKNQELLGNLREVLVSLNNIDYALVYGTVVPASAAIVSERQLNYTLHLKALLQSVQPLIDVLKATRHPIFKRVYEEMSGAAGPRQLILQLIGEVINDDSHPAKGHMGEMQRCFAIKTGLNGFLDVARRTYTEYVDDMRSYVEELSVTYSLPLRVQNNGKKGFHIVLPITKAYKNLNKNSLPSIFIRVEKFSNHFSMTTTDMVNFDNHLKNNSDEIQSISNVIIYKLLIDIRPHICHLYQLCDDVALLDVLVSLARVSVSKPGYVRPSFSDTLTEIVDARHPLSEQILIQEFVPNTVTISNKLNVKIITGPNMSGKSIYIRAIALNQILAQIGCYIPARCAIIRITNHIYARIAADDSLDGSTTSHFAIEMQEMHHVLQTVNDSSLLILDEMCKTTACNTGASMAMALVECFAKTKAFIFVATHFFWLTKMADMYPNVTNWHMKTVEVKHNTNSRVALKFTHKLEPGITAVDLYGIKLARIFAPIYTIADRAEELANWLLPDQKTLTTENRSNKLEFIKYRFDAELEILKAKGHLTQEIYNKKLEEFKELHDIDYETIELSNDEVKVGKSFDASCQMNRASTSDTTDKTNNPKQNSNSEFSSENSAHIFSFPQQQNSPNIEDENNRSQNQTTDVFSMKSNNCITNDPINITLTKSNIYSDMNVNNLNSNNDPLNIILSKSDLSLSNSTSEIDLSNEKSNNNYKMSSKITSKNQNIDSYSNASIEMFNDESLNMDQPITQQLEKNITKTNLFSEDSCISNNQISAEKENRPPVRLVSEIYSDSESDEDVADKSTLDEEKFTQYLSNKQFMTSTPLNNTSATLFSSSQQSLTKMLNDELFNSSINEKFITASSSIPERSSEETNLGNFTEFHSMSPSSKNSTFLRNPFFSESKSTSSAKSSNKKVLFNFENIENKPSTSSKHSDNFSIFKLFPSVSSGSGSSNPKRKLFDLNLNQPNQDMKKMKYSKNSNLWKKSQVAPLRKHFENMELISVGCRDGRSGKMKMTANSSSYEANSTITSSDTLNFS